MSEIGKVVKPDLLKSIRFWIIVVLMILFSFKSCQSCSRKQAIEFEKQKTEQVTDSLQTEIAKRDSTIYQLRKDMSVIDAERKANEYMIESLTKDKSDYQKINENLSKRYNEKQ